MSSNLIQNYAFFLAKHACGGKPCENNGTCQAGLLAKDIGVCVLLNSRVRSVHKVRSLLFITLDLFTKKRPFFAHLVSLMSSVTHSPHEGLRSQKKISAWDYKMCNVMSITFLRCANYLCACDPRMSSRRFA